MFSKILVCLDGSRFSSKALPYASEIARQFKSEIILLNVVRPASVTVVPSIPEGGVSPLAMQVMADNARQQDKNNYMNLTRYLKRKTRQLKAKGMRASFQVVTGEPAQEILKFCRQNKIDLVVMTTTGKSGIKRAILGSTTDVIMRAPGFPVLAIRPKE